MKFARFIALALLVASGIGYAQVSQADQDAFGIGRTAWDNHDCPVAVSALMRVSEKNRHGPWLMYAARSERCLSRLSIALTYFRAYQLEQPNEPAVAAEIAKILYVQNKMEALGKELVAVWNGATFYYQSDDVPRTLRLVDVRSDDCTLAVSFWSGATIQGKKMGNADAIILPVNLLVPASVVVDKFDKFWKMDASYTNTRQRGRRIARYSLSIWDSSTHTWDPFAASEAENLDDGDDMEILFPDAVNNGEHFKSDLLKASSLCAAASI